MVDSMESYDRTLAAAGAAAAKADPESIEQAEALYRKALTAAERAHGPSDLSVVSALTGLGDVLHQRGSPDEAAAMLSRAVSIAEQQLGADNPDVIILLNDVSRLHLRHAAHAHAEPLLQRLLDIKRVKGEDHPEVATVLASLASVRQAVGRHDEAEQLWRRVLDIRIRTLAPNHIATASALEHLGLSCAARGKIPEALQLLQRALSTREITLGPEHPSLRAVRERIADLQLQASDDLLDHHDVAPPPPSRLRLSVASHIASPLAAPAPVHVPKPTPQPMSQPAPSRPPTARVLEADPLPPPRMPVAVPQSVALAVNDALETPAPAQNGVPYLNVLMDIKDEIEDTEPVPASAGGWEAILGAIKVGLRERRAAAIGAAVAVLALPAIGYGVASAMRANRGPEWAESSSFAVAPLTGDSALTRASAPEALRAPVIGSDVHKDSTASSSNGVGSSSRARSTESRPSSRQVADDQSETPLLVQRPVVGRLDSVARSISVPSQNIGGSFEVQLQSSLDNAQRKAVAELTPAIPARRARLIGEPPVPRYPPQLAKSNVGGEVRIRFDVDTLGRPITGSYTVVSSPHPAFAETVRRLLPAMRFEPARTPGPVPQAVAESVEMSFRFAPIKQD